MKDLLTSLRASNETYNSMKHSARAIIRRAEIPLLAVIVLYKAATNLLFVPLMQQLWSLTLRFAPMHYLSNNNASDIFSSPAIILCITLIAILTAFWALYEFSVLLHGLDLARKGETIRLPALLRTSLADIRHAFLPQNWLVLVYSAVLIPFSNFFLAYNYITQLAVPEYIIGVIRANSRYYLLYLAAGAALLFLCVSWVLVLPLFAVFTRHVQTRMLAAQLDNRRAVAAVSGQVPETLHNIRTIRALGLEDYMERRYDRCIGDSYAAMERTNFYDAVYSPVVLLLNAAVVGIVMLLSASGNAQLLTLFGMSVGTSVAVINYISRIFAPIESLGMEIQTIQSAMAGVRRIDAFLDQPERTIPPARREAARGDVEFAHVTFGYGERHILKDFSMTVKQGEQVTLVGRTGAGKSTVFKLLLGLYQPQAGSVTIGGVDVARITDRERRTCIGCVEQHFSRVPGTVLEQITLGDPQITAEMARNAAKLAGIDEAIQALPEGCDTVCSDGMFSQGEWQLLSIARAAAADPAVLLLDEVTANLDAETEARVLEALRRASAGRTVLSVSHRIYENLGGRTVKIEPQSM